MQKPPVNPLDIYKSLNKSNCRECMERTCFAFASLVAQGQKKLSDCPHLSKEVMDTFDIHIEKNRQLEPELDESFTELKNKVGETNFKDVAERLGVSVKDDKLIMRCLGKNFIISGNGDVSSAIHVHSWILGPILNYITNSSTKDPVGKWVLFRELPSGERWNPLYMQRCEKPLLKIAYEDRDLFSLLISLFGKSVHIEGIEGDVVFLLYPLPKVPILICYSGPEEEFESQLNFYYDEKAEDNLNIDSIYLLAVGFAVMMEKLMRRHSR